MTGIALINVDSQVDFGTQDGSLYVPHGEEVVEEINKLRIALENTGYLSSVVLTQDSHPADHISFQVNNHGSKLFEEHVLSSGVKQMMWPVHCQIGTPGHEFLTGLLIEPDDFVVQKGTKREIDSYSGFGSEDGIQEITPLDAHLKSLGINCVVIGGLAFDYCVSATAKDAAKLGYYTVVVRSATRGISVESCDREERLMCAAGVIVVEDVEEAVKLLENTQTNCKRLRTSFE
jgi:nicotinamidase/pyrazinamidase